MKRRVLLVGILCLFVGVCGVRAEEDINLVSCEYSEEYLAWSKLTEEEKEKVQKPFLCKSTSANTTMMGVSNEYTLSRYSLRDHYVLDVRDQKDTDSCWSFASLAAIESNLLKNNIKTDYLSISHLELSNQDSLYKPNYVTFHRNFNSGGHFKYTSAYVLNNHGPVSESSLPFQTLLDLVHGTRSITRQEVENNKASVDVDQIMVLQNKQGACTNDTITTIKKYLVQYGALAAGVHFAQAKDDLTVKPSEGKYELVYKYLNGAYYYYDGTAYTDFENVSIAENQLPNHAVTIVGWDDNIEVESFSTAKPSRKGAWIVKNSYGKEQELEISEGYKVTLKQGDEGYFYISYDDISICTNLTGYFDADQKVSDYAYYYDDLGYNAYYTLNSDVLYAGNIFNKVSNKTEKIDKITFANQMPNNKYTVYLSLNSNFSNMQEIASGTANYNGYISVKPSTDLYVTDQFSIIVKYETQDGSKLIVPFAVTLDASDIYTNFQLKESRSYVSLNGINWADTTGDLKAQNSIRVYTSQVHQSAPSEVDSDEQIKDDANINVDQTQKPSYENNEVGDTTNERYEQNDIENPQTGMVGIVIAIILLSSLIIFIHYQIKNKLWKL